MNSTQRLNALTLYHAAYHLMQFWLRLMRLVCTETVSGESKLERNRNTVPGPQKNKKSDPGPQMSNFLPDRLIPVSSNPRTLAVLKLRVQERSQECLVLVRSEPVYIALHRARIRFQIVT